MGQLVAAAVLGALAALLIEHGGTALSRRVAAAIAGRRQRRKAAQERREFEHKYRELLGNRYEMTVDGETFEVIAVDFYTMYGEVKLVRADGELFPRGNEFEVYDFRQIDPELCERLYPSPIQQPKASFKRTIPSVDPPVDPPSAGQGSR